MSYKMDTDELRAKLSMETSHSQAHVMRSHELILSLSSTDTENDNLVSIS